MSMSEEPFYLERAPKAVQSSNEKSLLLQGLFAREFIQRIRGLGQSGGGKGIRTGDTIASSLRL
jgi:hypothetical protein